MGWSGRFRIRLKHHALLLLATSLLLLTVYIIVPGDDKKYLWSMATAYTSIILLAVTLMIGPLNLIRGKLNPVSTDLRRDIGIWCAATGLAHVIVGIQVHMGNIWLYFFKAVEGVDSFKLRNDFFGYANYAGLLAGLILLLLLLLSNDLSLNILKSKRWKSFQQTIYLLFVLTLAHGVMFQVIEKRKMPLVILFGVLILIPMIIQIKGFQAFQRKIRK